MKKLILLFLFVLNLSAHNIINGDSVIFTMPKNLVGELSIDGKKANWSPHPSDANLSFVVVAAGYHKKGEVVLKNKLAGKESVVKFKVIKGKYKEEKISVDGSKVSPPKDVLERIKTERDEANEIYATQTRGLKFTQNFQAPMSSFITSPFGTARTFNGTLKSYHSGTDYRAAVGEEVIAANDGVVVIAKDRYYAGGSVVVDHGEGIYTQYYHLSKIGVKAGDSVKKGEKIGLSGASGRVSGPHLHFGVMVRGAQVNPLNFIKNINSLF